MTITFEKDADVIVYAFEKIIAFAREHQYLFVANCVWRIAVVLGLEPGLICFIDNLESRKAIIDYREISEVPRDIARRVSPQELISDYIPDPLRRTRKGRINPLPRSKRSLKNARKDKRREEASISRNSINTRNLKEIRNKIIQNLSKE
jgi:hypothetical protein